MAYPRIYSISTVGIRKHYNQDYLLHPLRTDFTGINGVGKSIIADLIQLILIPDPDLIVFGTDGIDNNERQPYSLPYESTIAYAFLNIEVEPEKFIAVGVCLPNRRSRRIRSFIVLGSNDLDADISKITYPASKLLTNQHFRKDDTIPSIEDLTIHLRENNQVDLRYYTHKKDKIKFRSFLYNKEILPINVGTDSNLKAYAKVIQSFSKAKSLDIKKSQSLKKFLLEDTTKEYEDDFNSHKSDFKKLLDDYQRLNNYIEELTQKQKALFKLKTKEEIKVEAHKNYLTKDLQLTIQEQKVTQSEFKEAKQELQKNIAERKETQLRYSQTELRISKAEQQLKDNKALLLIVEQYRQELSELNNIKSSIKKIIDIDPPQINEEIDGNLDINSLDENEIVRKISFLKPIYEKYGSFALIESYYEEQKIKIEDLKQQTKLKISEINQVIDIISSAKSDSLLNKVVDSKSKLSIEQKTALFHIIDVSWNKPKQIEAGTRYTSDLNIISAENIEVEKEQDGIWLDYGNIKEFVELKGDRQLYNDNESIDLILQSKKEDLKKSLIIEEQKLKEIDNFQTDKDSNIPDLELDSRLKDYTAFQQVKEAALIAKNTNNKIASLKDRENIHQENISKLQIQIELEIEESNLEQHISKLDKSIKINEKALQHFLTTKAKDESRLTSLIQDIIPGQQKKYDELKEKLKDIDLDYLKKETKFTSAFLYDEIDLQTENNLDKEDIDKLEHTFIQSNTDYISEYKSATNLFQETKDRNNLEFNAELEEQTYKFAILERVLLGKKIKYTDKISESLIDSNREREKISESIFETMIKVFSKTKRKFVEYQDEIRSLNSFFRGRKISGQYFFKIDFTPHSEFDIKWLNDLQLRATSVYKSGEITFGESVETFIEECFKSLTNSKKTVQLANLLDPKSYFDLSASLTDENNSISGSTGQSYTAIVLLGIGRLSVVQNSKRNGIKFIILEETASLDNHNFQTVSKIAEEFGYQIITMTPKFYGNHSDSGWYLHNLIAGKADPNINYPTPASYYKTNQDSQDLKLYLEAINK